MRSRVDLIIGLVVVGICMAALAAWTALTRPLGPTSVFTTSHHPAWRPPDPATIPPGPAGDEIRFGRQVFSNTPRLAPEYTGAKLSCSDCHMNEGTQPFALPMIGLSSIYPRYMKRAGRAVSLEERIQQSFVRSENGSPPPLASPVMKGLVAYIEWLSPPGAGEKPFWGRGLMPLAVRKPNIERGAKIFRAQCMVCHGRQGQGVIAEMPRLWGADSFNDGAEMADVSTMARFVQHNMPKTHAGSLTAQEAYDVAGFIESHPRPAFNTAYKNY